MNIRVKYFAFFKDLTKSSEEEVDLPEGSTPSDLFDSLLDRYPEIEKMRSRIGYAVNLEFVPMTYELHEGDEVSFIPPVSGGI